MTFIKKLLITLLAIVLFLLALLIGADNSGEVSLQFLEWRSGVLPISYWMLMAFVFGVLFGSIINLASNTRLRLDVRRANKVAAGHAKELDQSKAQIGADA